VLALALQNRIPPAALTQPGHHPAALSTVGKIGPRPRSNVARWRAFAATVSIQARQEPVLGMNLVNFHESPLPAA